jgi:hypothetical protein
MRAWLPLRPLPPAPAPRPSDPPGRPSTVPAYERNHEGAGEGRDAIRYLVGGVRNEAAPLVAPRARLVRRPARARSAAQQHDRVVDDARVAAGAGRIMAPACMHAGAGRAAAGSHAHAHLPHPHSRPRERAA